MSLLEVRLLLAIAVKHKRILKQGDVKQAFVQSILPDNEIYVAKPPPGCPYTPPHTYWLLKRSLYGLRRAPCHWFEKATKISKNIGLTPCPHAPCLFTGNIKPGYPPLYLGLYVDDFIYFSENPTVEKLIEEKLQQQTTVDFMGKVTHFLGIKFQWNVTFSTVSAHISQPAFTEHLTYAK